MPDTPASRKWLTMTEYAQAMGISVSKVKRMKSAGEIPYHQSGSTVRIPADATDFEWLRAWQTRVPVPS